jgi:non-ribosomal peptide synthetase component E (peptide arylation enzyme)
MTMAGVKHPLPGVVYPSPVALETYLRAGILREQTLTDALAQALERHKDRAAVVGADGTLTYGELDEASDRLAASLLEMGAMPLDRALFQLGNCPEMVIALMACLKAGIIPVCTIAAHREAEIGAIGKHVSARLHFVQGDHKDDLAAFAVKMRGEIPSMRHIIVCRGEAPAQTLAMRALLDKGTSMDARDRLRTVERDPFQVAFFQLSGGTTGIPKIIPRFSNEYLYNFEAVAAALGYDRSDRLFTAGPLIHNAGMVMILGPGLLTGCSIAVSLRTDTDALRGIMRDQRPSRVVIRGPMLERLRQPDFRNAVPLDGIRHVMSTNAARLAETGLGVRGIQYFGMTEGTIMLTPPHSAEETRWTTVGRPISTHDEVRLLKPGTEEDVPFGETGELAVRGPYTVRGYYNDPDRDRLAFTSDGFYRSGDLMSAHHTECGVCYRVRGRIKDVIDRAGEKISCQEVEDALRAHPDVIEAAVVPAPDPVYGERTCAFVQLKAGCPELDLPRIREHLRELGLAKFKWPEIVEAVREFPQTAVGKLDKSRLKEMARSIDKAVKHSSPALSQQG